MLRQGIRGTSFYQRRLYHFGTGNGREIIQSRLSQQGREPITLPGLKFDEEVSYAHSDLVYVHRCLFHNQPVFIGGAIDRLCI
jgi:hypothetical protein